jgi:hypothetical protein
MLLEVFDLGDNYLAMQSCLADGLLARPAGRREARFADGGDHDPVARQIDGVAIRLVDGRSRRAGTARRRAGRADQAIFDFRFWIGCGIAAESGKVSCSLKLSARRVERSSAQCVSLGAAVPTRSRTQNSLTCVRSTSERKRGFVRHLLVLGFSLPGRDYFRVHHFAICILQFPRPLAPSLRPSLAPSVPLRLH